MTLDFPTVAQAALRTAPGLLTHWLPGGRFHGAEYDVRNPTRNDQSPGNFRINTQTGKWSDFATGDKGGDLISLRAFLDGISQHDAAEAIAHDLGMNGYEPDPVIADFLASLRRKNPKPSQEETCVLPVPENAPPAPLVAGQAIWTYLDQAGRLLGYITRIDKQNGGKDFFPLTYWPSGWQSKSWPRPRPLYNQPALNASDAPVLVVEGEKTAEAAIALFPDFVVVTWPGGSNSAGHADWTLLTGRRVWLLPDADDPGVKAMTSAATALQRVASEIYQATLPADLPCGWDVADWNRPVDQARAWLDGLKWETLKAPDVQDDRFADELRRANGQGPQYQVRAISSYQPEIIPVPMLARLEAEILRRAPMQHPVAAQQTALAIAARIAGRQCVTTANDPAHLYIGLAAPSVGYLRGYLSMTYTLMEQVGLQKSVRNQRLSAIVQVQKQLWHQPASLYLSNEWGVLLQFSKRQPAGHLEQTLGLISDLWEAPVLVLDTEGMKIKDADSEAQQIIRNPHLTILAALSHDHLSTAIKLSEMGRGALEQIQYWILEDDDFVAFDPDTFHAKEPWPADLVEEIKRLSAYHVATGGNLAGLMGPSVPPEQVIAPFSVPVQPFYAAYDALNPQRNARALLTASRFIVRRIASVLAFWRNPAEPVVTADLLGWSTRMEVARLSSLLTRFDSLSSDDGKLSAYQKVLDLITAEKTKGARGSDLVSGCWAYRALADDKREALIKQMLCDDAIVEVQPESKPGARRKALVYVAKAFVREVK